MSAEVAREKARGTEGRKLGCGEAPKQTDRGTRLKLIAPLPPQSAIVRRTGPKSTLGGSRAAPLMPV